ncbi:MAG: 1-(5-phosphoribosyl)-5-[(5-phosphoribosylamino)methylideneamino]imidazole-4-carboxamide isomerase [Saprospiraceae bacterium]|nr:1-(5-phosphoribosyl)-5-[(5-phosphoribosylamino)methylideneamino]imidazole-4-carboxamide isomerase [Saprospiraceae bacterium]
MKNVNIYPAIDLLGGKCVRLYKGDFNQKTVYFDDPVRQAKVFEDAGASCLHVIDLDAAKGNISTNKAIINEILSATGLKVQIGGGIKNTGHVEDFLGRGAQRVIAGSIAVSDRSLVFEWLKSFGTDKIVIGADVLNGIIATHGWEQTSEIGMENFISEYSDNGATLFLCTDISLDGTLQGSALDLYKKLRISFPDAQLIASGGIKDINDVKMLAFIGMESIIIGKAIYESKIDISELFGLNKTMKS